MKFFWTFLLIITSKIVKNYYSRSLTTFTYEIAHHLISRTSKKKSIKIKTEVYWAKFINRYGSWNLVVEKICFIWFVVDFWDFQHGDVVGKSQFYNLGKNKEKKWIWQKNSSFNFLLEIWRHKSNKSILKLRYFQIWNLIRMNELWCDVIHDIFLLNIKYVRSNLSNIKTI